MERKDRPLSREKNVSGGTAHVGRRDAGSGSGGQKSGRGGSRGGGSPLVKILILLAVVLFGGGGVLTGLPGGGGGGGSGTGGSTDTNPASSHVAPVQADSVGAELNTSVAPEARAKRVTLKGDGTDTTTILLYMCGTDLESGGGFASRDLQEMMAADMGENIHLLVYTGGCRQWQTDRISAGTNQTWLVESGIMTKLRENSSLQPMTDPATLAEFIQWGAAQYPADRYALIFWDHGGGSLSGYGYDEVYPRQGSMALDGIAEALQNGGVTFDFVGFDACLMATLETALVLEPHADYLIASEETEPGCGWYYTDWLNALSGDPSMPALEIGRNIADSFVQVCGQVAARQKATLSVLDLAEVAGTVPDSFRSFARATTEAIQSENYRHVAAARGSAREFAESSNIDQVDLIHLADNLDTEESRELAAVLRSAVKYNRTSGNICNANGVSIYFPCERTSSVNRASRIYSSIGLDESYTDCIRQFATLEVGGQTVSGGGSAQISALFGVLTGSGGGSASLSSEAVAALLTGLAQNGRSLAEVNLTEEEASFLDAELLERSGAYLTEHQFDDSALQWTEKDGQPVLALSEEQWDLIQDVELNVFVDDGSGYIDLGLDNVAEYNAAGDLLGTYDKTWLAVNGQIVSCTMLSSEGTAGDYQILGTIPAQLNGRRVNLVACFTDENPDGEILGADVCYDADEETETIARGLLDVQEGDTIDFLCDYYDYDRNYQDSYFLGDALTVSGPLTLSNVAMDNDAYIAVFRLTDIYHNHYWTPALA